MQQQHTPSDQVKSSGGDIKILILDVTKAIILGSRTAIKSVTMDELFSWGAIIESFDSFIKNYYLDDQEYKDKREQYMKEILTINPYAKDLQTKLHAKRIYDKWFSMICEKLARFKIFPPLPVSYVQGKGEMREVM